MKKGDRLTSADPQPPVGTVVRICDGTRWEHVEQPTQGTYWVPTDAEFGDPESWIKIAGNYGPAIVVKLP